MARAREASVVPLYRPRKCAVCGKPTVRQFHPFCSKRCADIDLGKWLTGRYAIPAVETDPSSEEGDNGEE
jgi:endogenous inhibitor of DNA gyrase (YacG/DUF329 family)